MAHLLIRMALSLTLSFSCIFIPSPALQLLAFTSKSVVRQPATAAGDGYG